MKVSVVKYKDMDIRYLMELLRRKNNNYEEIVSVLSERLCLLPMKVLLQKWVIEKNSLLKELIEIAIAKRFLSYTPISEFTSFPRIMKIYLENLTSFDALHILLQSRNRDIVARANQKYQELFDAYLDTFEGTHFSDVMYAFEGDDTKIVMNDNCKIISFEKVKKKKKKKGKEE